MYEIICNCFNGFVEEFFKWLDFFNDVCCDVFGLIENWLFVIECIISLNNCFVCDLVFIGLRFIFGYNVYIGLKLEISFFDVFLVYCLEDNFFYEELLDIFDDVMF